MNARAPLWRRVAAFGLDVVPVALVLDWATALSDAGVLAVTAVWVLIGGVAFAGRTPGKQVMGLRLEGAGCMACRELRRLWPILTLGLGAFALEAAALAGQVPSAGLVTLATLALVVGTVWTHLWPMSSGRAFPHDKATGFRVTLA